MRLHMFLKRLKIIVNLLLVLMKISYSKKFQCIIFPFIIMIHVTKKLWQISNFSFQGYTEPLNKIFHILVRKFHFAAFQFNPIDWEENEIRKGIIGTSKVKIC